MTFVEACRAWKAVTGTLPIPVTILLEGEEESGGVNLPPFLEAQRRRAARRHRPDLRHQHVGRRARRRSRPCCAACAARRSIITAADRDLHSGFYGSAAANPNHVLARILADLRDADGRVTLPGFYDGVPELPDALRAQWDTLRLRRRGLPRRGRPVGAGRREAAARCSR